PYSLEAPVHDAEDALLSAARQLDDALFAIADPMEKLAARLQDKLTSEAEDLDSSSRTRLEAVRQGILRRVKNMLKPWQAMLRELETGTRDGFVDWSSIERFNTREIDLGLHRHWIDPTIPFAETVLSPAHGVVITSATLRDESSAEETASTEQDTPEDWPEDWPASWQSAEMRTGLSHLLLPGSRHSVPSPFDYAAQTRVFVVTDVSKKDMEQVAAGYRALFEASHGGALGLFTAIARLKAVYGHLAGPMADAGLPLYAQHIDAFDPATLVEIFRAERDSCLLGTDAVRDGVDVPGEALRLIVFDRVPWPRPTILHRARREAFGSRGYDDMIARLRLKQAFGRLIRRQTDRGAFVMMDSACPTRLLSAFPPEITVQRLGLAEAVSEVRDFLGESAG
ncbi:MAG: helicase C-terminal domain-containing protein, partial [Alphaproteobacteria bacterium]|nr:helicase C-terminal domain-containing protein [Alphaproteobacteria bacterium]